MKELDVIYVDNHQLVVNKPAGLLTQPSGTDQDSLEALAKAWVKEQYQKPGNVFLEAVHRLDKPVSGIVLFGRTSKSLSRLNSSMRDKRSKKVYLALVEGRFKDPSGTLEHYLVHDDFHASVVSATTPDAKLARLQYRELSFENNISLIEIILDTGRYHQIRAQFSAVGRPIVGDTKYGSKVQYNAGEIALHHHQMQVPHPITDELQSFEAPMPKNWKKYLKNSV